MNRRLFKIDDSFLGVITSFYANVEVALKMFILRGETLLT